jgi:hypothetical protein
MSADYLAVRGHLEHGQVRVDRPLAELTKVIQSGRPLVLAGCCPPERALELRRAAHAWAAARPPHPQDRSASVAGLSFHRFDDEATRSLMPHVFHQIGLAAASHGDDALWALAGELMLPLLDLQNRLSDVQVDIGHPQVRYKIMNHPVGGGFLVKHVHPLERMGVAFFLSLSRPGVDYAQGDVSFEVDGRDVPAGGHFAAGNALFFRYDLPHAILPVDPARPRDWSDAAGLWLASVEPIGAYLESQRR